MCVSVCECVAGLFACVCVCLSVCLSVGLLSVFCLWCVCVTKSISVCLTVSLYVSVFQCVRVSRDEDGRRVKGKCSSDCRRRC